MEFAANKNSLKLSLRLRFGSIDRDLSRFTPRHLEGVVHGYTLHIVCLIAGTFSLLLRESPDNIRSRSHTWSRSEEPPRSCDCSDERPFRIYCEWVDHCHFGSRAAVQAPSSSSWEHSIDVTHATARAVTMDLDGGANVTTPPPKRQRHQELSVVFQIVLHHIPTTRWDIRNIW